MTFIVTGPLFVASLVAQMVKCLPTMWETRVQSLGGEDPLEKEMATESTVNGVKMRWTRLSDFTFFLSFSVSCFNLT